ncbi:calcium-regulated heat-stable protein 1-like [Oncorhynchus keta]|uniref:calcium-regulated heat-stable protein 1-like n=1 Tax=Oncorhynchus keta TaxID=8018 RepID=UPI00227A5E8B|nr:calcium-regulated heat-stable protein 1-like [Oncorhynchus keta]
MKEGTARIGEGEHGVCVSVCGVCVCLCVVSVCLCVWCVCVCVCLCVVSVVCVCRADRAAEGPSFSGVCKCFSRTKGHGFITPADGGSDIFVHISDIEGEYVPMEGDEVSYKVCSIPPKYQKIQAVDVTITHLNPGSKHETWGGALLSSS